MKSILLKSILGFTIGMLSTAALATYIYLNYWHSSSSNDLYGGPAWEFAMDKLRPIFIGMPFLGLVSGMIYGIRKRK